MKWYCMYCGNEKDATELQTIESVYKVDVDDPENTHRIEHDSDTLTVCNTECADIIRAASDVIFRDVPFDPKLRLE